MIEHLKIITGSPEKAAEKAQAYLTEHPNATVLGTAVTMKRGKPLEDKDAEPAKDAKPATKQAANALPAAAVLRSVEYGPDVPVVAITLGRLF